MVRNSTIPTSCQGKLWFTEVLGTQRKTSGHLTSYAAKKLNALSKLKVELVDCSPPGIHPGLSYKLCIRHLDFILAYLIET